MCPFRKVNNKLPPRHKDTKIHKEFKFNNIFLVLLCALAPLWQKKTIQSSLKD
jgi:hypothetical protein